MDLTRDMDETKEIKRRDLKSKTQKLYFSVFIFDWVQTQREKGRSCFPRCRSSPRNWCGDYRGWFKLNSEPHNGAGPSIRLCVGPELARCAHTYLVLSVNDSEYSQSAIQ